MNDNDNQGAAGADPLAMMADILRQMSLNQDRQDARMEARMDAISQPRVRAINCKNYKWGECWANYKVYYRENIRAHFGYAATDARLDRACCSWIGSKLEAGPTLTAYDGLSPVVKNDWDQLEQALSELYCNEEEKQLFLSNPGAFRKGRKSLMEYKNELTRMINTYQPNLANVDDEYQRQLVNRFIEGLEDQKLQRKLRFFCKRDKMNISAAYEFAVDYESAEVEVKVKEESSLAAAVPIRLLGATTHPPPSATASSSVGERPEAKRNADKGAEAKIKVNEMHIQELRASDAKIQDSIHIMKKDVDEKFESLDKRFDRLETLITRNQQPQHPPTTNRPTANGGVPMGATAAMSPHRLNHSMMDQRQMAFDTNPPWGEFLDYNIPSYDEPNEGTFSYYPSGFQ